MKTDNEQHGMAQGQEGLQWQFSHCMCAFASKRFHILCECLTSCNYQATKEEN